MADLQACPRCGAQVPVGARFCPSCGLNLAESPREERRVVTVLFGDLSGFTEMSERLDAEEVKSIVDRAFEGLAEIVTLYGGRVDKIIGDEIMAVFGAPQAHEDDAERAVRCALDMQRELARFANDLERDRGVRLDMRIGINTGEVVAGVVGDSYTVLGDAVNTASRIEHAAEPGQTLVGEPTHVATQHAIEYRELPQVVVKGKQEPLRVWAAVVERALPGAAGRRPTAPLIGRDEELSLLETVASIVRRDRKPSLVTVTGDAGMGKSRLADEFARRHETTGVRILAGRSLPYGGTSPSFALEEITRDALGVDAQMHPELARARAVERLERLGIGAEADRLLALIGLRERDLVASPPGAGAGPAARNAPPPAGGETVQAVARLIEEEAARSELTIVILHELHWAERPLLDFVGLVGERSRNVPVLVLCLARPEFLERRPDWLGRPGSVEMSMEPLPRDRAAALLDALLGPETIHPAVRDNVLERAGGNPFFLEELVRLLLDQKTADDARAPAISVPVSVHALVAARLDALPPDAKRLVQDASVVGDHFWISALRRLEPELESEVIEDLVSRLVERELIEPVAPSAIPEQPEHRFRQTIAREVAYAGIPKQHRARQHATVGAWLEETAREAGLDREFLDLIAYQYERAALLAREVGVAVEGAADKAREFLQRAGEQSLGLDAALAAADLFQRALALAGDDQDRMPLRIHLAEALIGCARPDDAEPHLNAAMETARASGDRAAEARALRLLGDLHRMKNDVDGAREALERALEIAKQIGDTREESAALRSRGLVDLFSGRISAASLWFRQSLARAREIQDRRGEGWSLQSLAWADLLLGRFDEALESLALGAQVFGELGDYEGVGWCLGLRTWALFFLGKLAEADELQGQIEQMIEAAPAAGSPGGMEGFGLAIGRTLRALISVTRLQLSQAESLARQAVTVCDQTEFEWGSAMGRVPLAIVALLRRLPSRARSILEEASSHARLIGDPVLIAILETLLAEVELMEGNLDEALRRMRESRARGEQAQVDWIVTITSTLLDARVLRERGRAAEARARLEAVRDQPGTGLFPQSLALALLAEVLCDLGDASAAEARAREAVDRAAEHVWARAEGLLALARALTEGAQPERAESVLLETVELLRDGDWNEGKLLAYAALSRVLETMSRSTEAADARSRARAILDQFPSDADASALEKMVAPG